MIYTAKQLFFRGASRDSLSLAQFSIFCNVNLGKYCSNVALLYANWLNKLTLSVSAKKFLKTCFFHRIKPPPPPPPLPNAITKPVNFSIPNFDDLLENLNDVKYFITLDSESRGYLQVNN